MAPTVYDVTTWSGASVSPYVDIGTVINEIIADIKSQQTTQTTKPGAVVYIPPGHYDLLTRVVIDISYLQIKGSGHGFMSQAIRDESNTQQWYETLPGGSHIMVKNTDGNAEAFLVDRPGDPGVVGRINSVEFRDFCINGVSASKPYVPGNLKIGIRVQADNDSFRIEGMGFCYLRTAAILRAADAYNITNNFIAECGSCIELTAGSIVGLITNNYLISAWGGSAIFAENGDGIAITGNSILWNSRIHFKNVRRSTISSNKFVNHWPGSIAFEEACDENLISGNKFTRTDVETQDGSNGFDDVYGIVHLNGDNNAVISNLFTYGVAPEKILPSGATPTVVLVKSGHGNYLASNHIVSNVGTRIVLDASTTGTKLLYTAQNSQFHSYTTDYAFVATP
jgi:inulin fructotransferase (DFA-I-forming)